MPDETNGAGQVPAASTTSDTANGQVPAASTNTTTTASTPTEPTAGTSSTTATTDTSANGSEPSLTLEQALDALKKARGDAAKNRVDSKRLAELEEVQRKAELAKLDDRQRLEKELGDLQAKYADTQRTYQERLIRAEVRAQAASVGIPPELAGRLLDYSEITYSDDGEPENIGKLLSALAKQYPQLATNGAQVAAPAKPQPTSVGANPANPARGASSSGALSHEYLDSLTAQQYANLPQARRQEIMEWMAANPKPARPN